MKQVFSETAKYYDKLYQWKDYGKEIDKLIKLIRLDLTDKSHTLLDVACGTGEHIKYLKNFFNQRVWIYVKLSSILLEKKIQKLTFI